MKFRFKAFGLHLLGSVCLLALLLGGLYLGWYRWPGWYLAGALRIALIMVGIDAVLGPLLTLVIANPSKPRRELARDIGVIVLVQMVAAGYGFTTLWNGRPLYYTYSEGFLQMVQAADLNTEQVALGEKQNPQLAPHWYSLPRWIYAPLPKDEEVAGKIVSAAILGGDDVIDMPRLYRPWEQGLADIRHNLHGLTELKSVGFQDKKVAAQRLKQAGFAPEQPMLLPMLGKDKPLVAVVDTRTAQIKTLIRVD
jgi:hypothetical protein